MKTFQTIKEAANFISSHANTGNEQTINDCLCFGMGLVYAYSWGGSSLIYNRDIAERLCSPSELKRATNKNGLRDYPNSREHWLDVQARALNQASRRVISIAAKYLSK